MDKFVIRQSCLLFLTALIWGVAFVAQSAGMEYVEPFTFSAVRNILGGFVLIPCIFFLSARSKRTNEKNSRREQKSEKKQAEQRRLLMTGGAICGVLLFIATNFQQFGIQETSVGKAGFITALYIIIVPILGIFVHRRAGFKIWLGVVLALAGLYLLCIQENLRVTRGDGLVLVCAFTFSFHILFVDYFAPKVDGVKLACIQFFVCGTLSTFCMFLFEKPQLPLILAAWLPISYAGILSCGVAYTLQIVGQEGMNPTVASLILSMESVISVLAGWLLLHEILSGKELLGCFCMFAAIVIAQLPERAKRERTV